MNFALKIGLMKDNKEDNCIIIRLRRNTMDKILNFFQEILMIKKEDNIKVGLTQFRSPELKPVEKEVSIRTKDVKLSDLMRRVS